jgi:plastocyanin
MTRRLGGGVRRGGGLLLGLVLVSGALAGCGGDESPAAPAATAAPAAGVGTVTTADDGVQEITLQTQDDFTFTPARFTVDPGRVRLTVVNVAEQMTHNLEFTSGEGPEEIAEGISILAPGDEKTIEFAVEVPGEHPFECSFHVPQGQVGTMTVRG